MPHPVVIGIGGGTGSGKTTIADAIQKEVKDNLTIITQDSYYKSFDNLEFAKREKINYDHPDTFDNDLLVEHLTLLKNLVPIQMPVYDYTIHLRKEETIQMLPSKIIILEGILIFENPKLRELMDIKIFVDTAADIRILRRITRDMTERERSLESVMEQYRTTVRPMHNEFVEPSKRFADVIIPEGGSNRIGIEMIVASIKNIIE